MLRMLSRRGEPSRDERRIIVTLAAAGIGAVLPVTLITPRGAGVVIAFLSLAVLAVPLYALQEFRRNVIRRANADERERRRRDEAYRLSYRVIEYGMPLTALVLIFSDELGRIPGWQWSTLWLVVFGYVIFLPYMIFAWREPEAAPD